MKMLDLFSGIGGFSLASRWAGFENGPLKPIRVNGRLAWSVNDIKKILNCIDRLV